MKTRLLAGVTLLCLSQLLHGAEHSAFRELQAFLAAKIFTAKDAGNTVSERISVDRDGENLIFAQNLHSDGPEGAVEVALKWRVPIPLFLGAKTEKQEFFDKTVKISFVSESRAEVFPFEGTTTMRTRDGQSASEPKSGKADNFGISFKD